MIISEAGLRFISGFEGLSNTLYNDDGKPSSTSQGNATIGIGHLVHYGPIDGRPEEAPFANGLTDEQCYALLREDAQRFADHVNANITVPLNQNQFDALVSFTLNLGSLLGARDVVNRGGDVCAELVKYILPAWASAGLLRRRRAECALYQSPVTQEDTMKRLNGVSTYFHNRVLAAGDYLVNVDKDFPAVPAGAMGLRVEPVLDVPVGFVLRDFNGLWAGPILPPSRTEQLDVFIGPINEPPLNGARGFRMHLDLAVMMKDLGIVGYW